MSTVLQVFELQNCHLCYMLTMESIYAGRKYYPNSNNDFPHVIMKKIWNSRGERLIWKFKAPVIGSIPQLFASKLFWFGLDTCIAALIDHIVNVDYRGSNHYRGNLLYSSIIISVISKINHKTTKIMQPVMPAGLLHMHLE